MPAPLLDLNRPDDRHTAARLAAEPVIWLGTVSPDGRPHHVPVWFAFQDPLVLAFTMPGTRKWRHLKHSARLFRDKYLAILGPDNFAPWRETFSEPVLVTVDRVIAWTRNGSELAYRVVP
jgi:predicted pyridoxine 5'-phosphate oxidase superfamily flavin-nucleotide-binding protein